MGSGIEVRRSNRRRRREKQRVTTMKEATDGGNERRRSNRQRRGMRTMNSQGPRVKSEGIRFIKLSIVRVHDGFLGQIKFQLGARLLRRSKACRGVPKHALE